MSDEGIAPSIYEVLVGWNAVNPVMTVYAVTYTLEDALRDTNEFIAMYPWPASAPDVVAIRLLCVAEHVVISKRLLPAPLTPDDTQEVDAIR